MDFQPLSPRNGNKGQNQGQSPRAFIYEVMVNFFYPAIGVLVRPTTTKSFINFGDLLVHKTATVRIAETKVA